MKTKTMLRLCFMVWFILAFVAPSRALAEKTLALKMGQEAVCENLTASGKPASGGYDVENIWVQRAGIINYAYDDDKGMICLEPVGVGSTRVKVTGTVFELDKNKVYEPDRNKQLKYNKRFYLNLRVRVRPQ